MQVQWIRAWGLGFCVEEPMLPDFDAKASLRGGPYTMYAGASSRILALIIKQSVGASFTIL